MMLVMRIQMMRMSLQIETESKIKLRLKSAVLRMIPRRHHTQLEKERLIANFDMKKKQRTVADLEIIMVVKAGVHISQEDKLIKFA